MTAPAAARSSTPSVTVSAQDGQFVLYPHHVLNAGLGDLLADATAGVADVGGRLVCVDLTGVEEFTEAGVDALRTCRRIAHAHGVQLRFRADSAIARQFLLTLWAQD